ncbi:Pls/PosA family non-ribosomal peptide synthetase [Streptomyces sp. NBC_01435]|uniref:Pls/PosA family non-ribosomal peptide synthetase n=1 Tax=Streptomyces sp. NBC_01435 TaxID=2903865 RepID=UPI002E34D644|nr:Pls/PosA family non-ribosomal peptide synthetase [Streptomyces sp. NBC_01435]
MASRTTALRVPPAGDRTGPERTTGADRLNQFFEAACDRTPSAIALECGAQRLTYADLDRRANQVARHLRRTGIGPGSVVALLLPQSVETYVCLLGICKAEAAFVPIDPAAPPDRVAFILSDVGASAVLTTSALASGTAWAGPHPACPVVEVDTCAGEFGLLPSSRPPTEDRGEDDPLAYVIYTSGSSGRPKGVQIARSSICNFLRVVAPVYGVRPRDRVYQGMSISFDFSIEEIWPTWAAGATLVAGPAGPGRLGAELADFLQLRGITVLYCVPTLLATIPHDLPRLRSIVVGGEACPAALVERWSRPGRRMLNTYGPTEATVTATWQELLPGRPVTIGRPLPTYSAVLLDERRRPVPPGAVGEICLGGPGLARGYVGRPDLTADRFVAHPLAPGGGTLYRTGDLGRMTPDGEIEYLGRADAEVKIRGYRVSLEEIDSVLMEDPGVAQAGTALRSARDGDGFLAAYVVRTEDLEVSDGDLTARLHERLSRSLPVYMVPSTLDFLDRLPVMPSGKTDRRRLPPPAGHRFAGAGHVVPVRGELETRVRDAWAQVLGIAPAELSAEADFFTDLGGHSLLAARAVSSLRDQAGAAGATLRDLYENPTVRKLAAHLGSPAGPPGPAEQPRPAPLRHGRRRIARAGLAQLVAMYGLLLLLTGPVALSYSIHQGQVSGWGAVWSTVTVLAGYVAVRWIVPVAVARPLAAGIRPGRYPLWGATYLRLWVLDVLVHGISPLRVLSGSPLMGPYLRLLGAHVGPDTTIATSLVGLPALLRIDRDAAIGYGAVLRPWQVSDGWVTVAPITIGERAFVGANAVCEPGACLGPGSALGEQSVAGPDDPVPAGARRAGSPARPVTSMSPSVEAMLGTPGGTDRWQPRHLAAVLLGLVLLEAAAVAAALPSVTLLWWAWLYVGPVAGIAAAVLAGPVFVITVCLTVAVGKRMVLPRTPPGTHPARSALGVRKWIADKLLEHSLMFTNSLYATLYTAPWLRLLGARIGRRAEVSTVSHIDPDLLTLGDGSFVADMAGIGVASFAAGRMTFEPTEVGARSFVGNAALVPAGTRLGPGCLIGVGTVPPMDRVPADSTWLGSPALRLPVRQDSGTYPERLTFSPSRKAVLGRLAIEFLRITMPASVLAVSGCLYLLALSVTAHRTGPLVPLLASPLLAMGAALAVIAYCVLAKWVVAGKYRPRVEPLWSLFVRRTEFVTGLFEAAAIPIGVALLVGTPFLPPVLRRFGARIGRRTWIGTTFLTEFDLVEVGDDAEIGMNVSLQSHLFEDRVMKMSTVNIGAGASIGTRTVVLYDTVVGADVRLGALSLVMKGERLTSGTNWQGLPAEGTTVASAAPAPRDPAPAGR